MALLRLTKRSAGVVPCPPDAVYDVLTDYDSYVDWMPFIAGARLLAKEGELAIAEFELARNGKLVTECIHARNQMVLGRTIAGDLPPMKIQWDLAPAQEGQTSVALTVETGMSWRWLLPKYRRFLSAPRLFEALRRHAATFGGPSPDSGEKVLEVVETPDGLIVTYRGKQFVLKT